MVSGLRECPRFVIWVVSGFVVLSQSLGFAAWVSGWNHR